MQPGLALEMRQPKPAPKAEDQGVSAGEGRPLQSGVSGVRDEVAGEVRSDPVAKSKAGRLEPPRAWRNRLASKITSGCAQTNAPLAVQWQQTYGGTGLNFSHGCG